MDRIEPLIIGGVEYPLKISKGIVPQITENGVLFDCGCINPPIREVKCPSEVKISGADEKTFAGFHWKVSIN
jgi:hypothetical protein